MWVDRQVQYVVGEVVCLELDEWQLGSTSSMLAETIK